MGIISVRAKTKPAELILAPLTKHVIAASVLVYHNTALRTRLL